MQTGKSRFALQTLAAEEFPTVAQAEHYNANVTLPQKTLKHLFNMVHFSMAQQDIRYYLNGLLLVLDGKNVIAVATDGHRLAFCQVETEQEFPRQEVIIPRKTIIELQRLLEENDEPVQLDIAANQVKLTLCRHRTGVQAGRRQIPRLHPRDPEGLQERLHDRPRRTAAFAAARRDHDQRQVQGRALHHQRRAA